MRKIIVFPIVLTLVILAIVFQYDPRNPDFEIRSFTYQGKTYADCIFVPSEQQPWWTQDPKDQTICFRTKEGWFGMEDYVVALVEEGGKVIPVDL